MTEGNILIIDDDLHVLQSLKMLLKRYYTAITTLNNTEDAINLMRIKEFDVILLDMNFSKGFRDGKEGLKLLRRIRNENKFISIVLITAYGDIETAIEAMKLGATDFILKPWKNEKLLATVNSAFLLNKTHRENYTLRETQKTIHNNSSSSCNEIIGNSVEIKEMKTLIEKISSTAVNVLITGENGTGKELVARALHFSSNRSKLPFIQVDLGAISESLFESELFGYNKGAFTDAKEDKPGRIELANKGTLFLDEIGNLSLAMQAKLLSILQNKIVVRIGSVKETKVDFRLICATNCNLEQMVQEGLFREDLLYRINTVNIEVPPLRKRSKDIILLFEHFFQLYIKKYNKPKGRITSELKKELTKYSWPGNVRELKHTTERAVILSDDSNIESLNLISQQNLGSTNLLKLDDLEKHHIEKILRNNRGKVQKTADDLGISRFTLHRKMKKYGL